MTLRTIVGAENIQAPASALEVLYADAALAVVNKPAGLMVHDSALARGETDFAADRLREQFGRPIFLVHRLDRATSGCLLLAFDRDSASALGKSLMSHDVQKEYWAVCRGWPAEAIFTVDHPLDGGPGKPQKKPAITAFEVLSRCELPLPSASFETSRYAWLRASPQTGRFRQIRRHLKHLSHHLIGDSSHVVACAAVGVGAPTHRCAAGCARTGGYGICKGAGIVSGTDSTRMNRCMSTSAGRACDGYGYRAAFAKLSA